MPPSYLPLELRILLVPQLDSSLSEERPPLDGLKSLLVLRTLESVSIEIHIVLRDRTRTLSSGVFLGPLRGELSRGHLLRGHIRKVSFTRNNILSQKEENQSSKSGVHFFPTKHICQYEFR